MILRSPMTRAIALRVLALLGLVSVPGKYGFEEECQESLGSANGPKTFQLFQKAGSFGRVVVRGFFLLLCKALRQTATPIKPQQF